jgi:hypothetical protein
MSKSQYMPIPNSGDVKAWQSILDRMPTPVYELDGMKFKERVILPTNQPNRKNHETNTNINLARNSDTTRDPSQIGSFSQGIIPTEQPPRTIWIPEEEEDDLWGGFGRSVTFAELGIKYWVYDRYEYDESTRNDFQTSNLDTLEDQAISDNGRPSAKPPTKNDYLGILVGKIQRNEWDKDTIIAWFDTIDHCLTKDQIRDYASDAIKRHKALGRIEFVKESDVKAEVNSNHPGLHILNTSNGHKGNVQRFLRTLPYMMQSYIMTDGATQEYCLWNSSASSHEEMDDSHEELDKYMIKFMPLVEDFVDTYRFRVKKDNTHRACVPSKVFAQKIGEYNADEMRKVVDYNCIVPEV